MEHATRPLTEPRTSHSLRRRLLRHHLPLALASAAVLVLFLSLPRFDASKYAQGDIFSGTFPRDFPTGQTGQHGGGQTGPMQQGGGHQPPQQQGGGHRPPQQQGGAHQPPQQQQGEANRLVSARAAKEIAYAASRAARADAAWRHWSKYWYDGRIYESDITRGLLIWNLSDPAVAGADKLGHLHPQTQEFTIG